MAEENRSNLQGRPILQGEYKLLSVLETVGDNNVYKSQSVNHPERIFAVHEFKLEGYEAPEKRAVMMTYFRPIADGYMDFTDLSLSAVRNFFMENGYMYFLFDYVPGWRLSNYYKARQRPFTENSALDIARQIARALDLLHNSRPVKFMADLSISNVVLASNGYIMLTDYGLGKLLLNLPVDAPRMGTVGYAAPEQYGASGIITPATDIYALGVLMHQLVTYRDPQTNPGKLPPIEELNPAISPEYCQIVRMATQVDPKRRFLSARDMEAAIVSIAPKRGKSVKNLKRNPWKELIRTLTAPFVAQS